MCVFIAFSTEQVWAQSKRPFLEKFRQERTEPGGESPGAPQDSASVDDGIRINWRMLKLTAEQREEMQQLRRTFQIDTAGIQKEFQFVGQDLWAEMLKEPLNEAKIDELVRQTAELKRRLSEAAVQNLLAIKELLTDEQRQKLADFQQPLPAELRSVSLTSLQRSQIRELLKDSKRKSHELLSHLGELKDELRDMMFSMEDVDRARLQQVQAEIAEQELALERSQVDNVLAIRNVLTPEQRKALGKAQRTRQKDSSKTR